VNHVTSTDEIIKNVVGNQAGLQNYLNELLIFDAKNLRHKKICTVKQSAASPRFGLFR
jgi:hypothetical protein